MVLAILLQPFGSQHNPAALSLIFVQFKANMHESLLSLFFDGNIQHSFISNTARLRNYR